MANDIKLLDCTLRDGGYVNKWRFGNGNMTCIYDRLTQAGVDIIEIGFLDDREPFDPERSIQPDTDSLSKTFAGIGPKSSMVVAMIDYGTCSLDKRTLSVHDTDSIPSGPSPTSLTPINWRPLRRKRRIWPSHVRMNTTAWKTSSTGSVV